MKSGVTFSVIGQGISVKTDYGRLYVELGEKILFDTSASNTSGHSSHTEFFEVPDVISNGAGIAVPIGPIGTSAQRKTVVTEPFPETKIAQTKRWRRDLDAILQEMRSEEDNIMHRNPRANAAEVMDWIRSQRDNMQARESARIHIVESIMWCGMVLKALGTADPYPQSRNPASPVVEPTSDKLRL